MHQYCLRALKRSYKMSSKLKAGIIAGLSLLTAFSLSLTAQAKSATSDQVVVGNVSCIIGAATKAVGLTLTENLGAGYDNLFHQIITYPITMPKECVRNPDYCEGGDVRTGRYDKYIDIKGQRVRFISTYGDNYGSAEIRTHIAAAYESSEYGHLNDGVEVTLQYGDVSYGLYCSENLK